LGQPLAEDSRPSGWADIECHFAGNSEHRLLPSPPHAVGLIRLDASLLAALVASKLLGQGIQAGERRLISAERAQRGGHVSDVGTNELPGAVLPHEALPAGKAAGPLVLQGAAEHRLTAAKLLLLAEGLLASAAGERPSTGGHATSPTDGARAEHPGTGRAGAAGRAGSELGESRMADARGEHQGGNASESTYWTLHVTPRWRCHTQGRVSWRLMSLVRPHALTLTTLAGSAVWVTFFLPHAFVGSVISKRLMVVDSQAGY